jgi:ubiquinone/menaquinone biosynthesis C-methylase UbiE
MAGTARPHLRLFSGDAGPVVDNPAEPTDRLFHREAFRKPPRGEALEPFSQEWFERMAECRYERQGYWLPRVLEFAKHRGERLLALGEGLGTDWVQYAKNGADVSVLCPSQEQLELIHAHFDLCGVEGRFVHGSVQALPIPSDTIDVVCLFGMLHEVDEPEMTVHEVFRVLRPGGKVIAVAPARYNAHYWSQAALPWRRLFARSKSENIPAAQTAKTFKELFGEFVEHRVSKRHLRRGELPPLWRWAPLPALERLMGNLLILKAFKPLSTAANGENRMAA